MKKLISLTIASGLALAITGCAAQPTVADAMKIDVKDVCNVEKNGIAKVLATAKAYNPIAVKKQHEFMRFGATTSAYIKGIEAAIKSGSKTAHVVGKKKKIQKYDLAMATHRACSFAVRAVQLGEESKSTYRLVIPGDGFKY